MQEAGAAKDERTEEDNVRAEEARMQALGLTPVETVNLRRIDGSLRPGAKRPG
jgi:hypothetical protein